MSAPAQDEARPLVFFVTVQLKYGCGDPSCMNPHCRSSPNFRHAAFFTSLQGTSSSDANSQIAALAMQVYAQNKGNAICLPSVRQTLAMWILAIDKLPNSPVVPLNHRCWTISSSAQQAVTGEAVARIREAGLNIQEVVDVSILRTTVECNLTNFDAMRRFCQFCSKEYVSLECDFDCPCFSGREGTSAVKRSQAFLERLYTDVQQNSAFYSILIDQAEREIQEEENEAVQVAVVTGPSQQGSVRNAGRPERQPRAAQPSRLSTEWVALDLSGHRLQIAAPSPSGPAADGAGAQDESLGGLRAAAGVRAGFQPLESRARPGPVGAFLRMVTQSIGDISTLFDIEPDIACEPKHVPVFIILLSLPERLFAHFPGFFQNICHMIYSLSLRLKVEFVHLLKQYCEFLNRREALKAAEFVHQTVSRCQKALLRIMASVDQPASRVDAVKLLGERDALLPLLGLLTMFNHINVRGRGSMAPSTGLGGLGRETLRVFSPEMIPSAKDLTEAEAIEDAVGRALDPHSRVPTCYISQREFENSFLDSRRYNYGPDMDYFLSKYRKLASEGLLAQLEALEPTVVREAREAEERRQDEEAERRMTAERAAALEARGVAPARSYAHPLSSPGGASTSAAGASRPVAATALAERGALDAPPGATAFGDMNSIPPDAAFSTDQSETDDARPRPRRLNLNPLFAGNPVLQIVSQMMGMDDRFRPRANFPDHMFTFLQYPFVLSAAAKAALLRYECTPQASIFQSRIFINRNNVVNDTLSYIIGHSDMDNPNSWRSRSYRSFLRVPLNVTFDEEEGIDQGGLKTEFFNLLCDELFSPKYGLFDLRESSKTYYWKKRPDLGDREEANRLYCFAGMVFAMCVLNQVNVNSLFPHVFYRKLMGDLGSLEDLAGLDPELYKGLCQMWYMGKAALAGPEASRLSRPTLSVTELLPSYRRGGKTGEEYQVVIRIPDPGYDLESDPIYSVFCCAFTAPGSSGVLDLYDLPPIGWGKPGKRRRAGSAGFSRTSPRAAADAVDASAPAGAPSGAPADVELVPGGADIPVCLLNFAEYIAIRVDYEVNASVAVQFQNFQEGFMLVAGSKALTLFSSSDLEVSIVGDPTLDFEALRRVTTYEEPFSASHRVVRWFWDVVINDFTEEERRQLLKFVTGSPRAPVGGLAKLPFRIFPNGEADDMLPTSHTCYNVLMLPKYSSREALRDKLRKAVGYCEGFGLK